MSHKHRIVQPGYRKGTVISTNGDVLVPPDNWAFLSAGDSAITRSVKQKGITWIVQVRKGKRVFSKGVWANKAHIIESTKEVEAKRSTPEYAHKRKIELARKEAKHQEYIVEFYDEILKFLNFHEKYQDEAEIIAEKVTKHATPVGSGTVARTKRMPVSSRAEAAVLAWMRHKTTAYDSMKIARIKGKRREIRKILCIKSIALLENYRSGEDVSEKCPLKVALRNG